MAKFALGHVEPYDEKDDDWESYIERFELFVKCNNISKVQVVPTLLTLMGKNTYKILKDLSTPVKPEQKTFEEIKNCLQIYFEQKLYFISERVKFNNRVQSKNESIQQYVKEIKKLSSNCKFGDGLIELLRDRLVNGVYSNEVKRKFRFEKDENLTFDKAFEIAIQTELAMKDTDEVHHPEEINFMKKKTNRWSGQFNAKQNQGRKYHQSKEKDETQKTSKKCTCCGRSNHTFFQCKYKEYSCNICKHVGHLAYNCKKKVRGHTILKTKAIKMI